MKELYIALFVMAISGAGLAYVEYDKAHPTDDQLIEDVKADVENKYERVRIDELKARGPKYPDRAGCYKIIEKDHTAKDCRFYASQGWMLIKTNHYPYNWYVVVNKHVDECYFNDRFMTEEQVKPVECPKTFVE